MAAQSRRPDAVLAVVDEASAGSTGEVWWSQLRETWPAAPDEVRHLDRDPDWHITDYPHPSAIGWHRGTRESGWKEVPEGVAGRYSDDQHAHLARLRNWTVERALELWPQCTHVWCTDSDVATDPDVLELLLAADKPVVGAVVRNSETSFNFMLGWNEAGEPFRTGAWETGLVAFGREPVRVSLVGACCLYSRDALDLGLRWGPHKNGEDYALAIQARELNTGLWVEPRARTRHWLRWPDEEPLR